jgi:heptosyltransferase-2
MLGLKISDSRTQTWLLPETSDFFESNTLIGLSIGPKIVISLGAGHARRNYPPETLIEVIKKIHLARPDIHFVLIGPNSLDLPKLDKLFFDLANTQNLIGKTDLRLAAEIISCAVMVIANDSGFAHLAASFEIPTLVISAHPLDADPWHLHSPNRYHPWMTEYIELQPLHLQYPCVGSCQAQEPHCIKTVLAENVVIATLSLLDKTHK